MAAFMKPISSTYPNDMTSKEKMSTIGKPKTINPILMANKVRCKTCSRRLHAGFDGSNCKRQDCQINVKSRIEILTFKDWKRPKFTVIEDLNCSKTPLKEFSYTDRWWNPATMQWEDRDIWDGVMC